jgi:hypothetical protein
MIQCPLCDWLCPYYDNGDCFLENCEKICGAFFTRDKDEEAKEEEEEIEDKYTLDDLGNNWY